MSYVSADQQMAEAVRARFLDLPQRDQLIVTLFYLECLTTDEIALVLNVRADRVRRALNRARCELRAARNRAEAQRGGPGHAGLAGADGSVD